MEFLLFFFFLNFRYEQAEFIEREMEQMTEQIKSVIQTLNANQVIFMEIFISVEPPSFSFSDREPKVIGILTC